MPETIPESIQSFEINMSDTAARRPILAAEAARLFALWANVEYALGAMASVLIGDNAALALLDQLRSKNQKLDGIRAAAAEKVNHAETRELLRPLFRLIGKASEPRNEFAHCLWGTIDQLPDALLLTDPAAAMKATRLINSSKGKRESLAPTSAEVVFEHAADLSNDSAKEVIRLLRYGTKIWRQSDFNTPWVLLNRATIALSQYTVAVSCSPEDKAAVQARNQLRDFLAETEQYY